MKEEASTASVDIRFLKKGLQYCETFTSKIIKKHKLCMNCINVTFKF